MTSIEWLIKELYTEMNLSGNGRVLDEILEEAKEMHKQEIIDAYNDGEDGCPEQYYAETFVSKGSDECQTFEKMYDTTSATLCANCGKEKFLHKT